MSGLQLLVIEPDTSAPAGQLGVWLRDCGADLDVRSPEHDALPDSLEGYRGLVCLGGGMGVHDVSAHPWLLPLQRLLAKATSDDVPTLTVCLGAQLLATATGGTVAADDGSEVGAGLVSKRDAAWQDPLLADVPLLPDVLQFHADSIAQLPGAAELLLSSAELTNQAFRVGRCAYGLQFHIETTVPVVDNWVGQRPDLAARARDGAFEPETLAQVHRDLEQVWQPVVANFVRLVRGEIEPAPMPRRALPLN